MSRGLRKLRVWAQLAGFEPAPFSRVCPALLSQGGGGTKGGAKGKAAARPQRQTAGRGRRDSDFEEWGESPNDAASSDDSDDGARQPMPPVVSLCRRSSLAALPI